MWKKVNCRFKPHFCVSTNQKQNLRYMTTKKNGQVSKVGEGTRRRLDR
jgi:hypothetical protein